MTVRNIIQPPPQAPVGNPQEIDWDAEVPDRAQTRLDRFGRDIIHQTANLADVFSFRERTYTAPKLEGVTPDDQPRSAKETMDDQVEPVLANLISMDTITQPERTPDINDKEAVRIEMGRWDEELKKQCDIFVDNASVYMAISWLAWVTDKPIDESLLMELMKEASLRDDGNKRYLWDVISGKEYYLNLGSENSIFGEKISWYINRFIGWFTCWLASMILVGTIENVCERILNFASKGAEQNDTLVKIGSELSKILNRHTGKYLKAIETYVKGQDKEGVLSEHITEEMSKIRGQMEAGIYRDFSALFCDNFLPWIIVKTDGTWIKYLLWGLCVTFLWAPILLLHLYIRYKGLPDAIHSVLHSSAGAMKFKPAQHALNCTLEPHLNDVKKLLKEETPSTSTNEGDDQEPLTKQNIKEAVSKLLKILELEPFHTKDEIEKVLNGTGKGFLDSELKEKLLSAYTLITQGKTVDQVLNSAVEDGLNEILVFALNYFLKPLKAKQVLSNIMGAFNKVFDRQVLKTTEDWNRWHDEYIEKQKTVRKICDSIVRMVLTTKTNEIIDGPPVIAQNILLVLEVGKIKKSVFTCREVMDAELKALRSSLENNDPIDSLDAIEKMKHAISAVANPIYIRDRKELSDTAHQKLLDKTRPINRAYTKITELLIQIKEKLIFKEYFYKIQGIKESLIKKMKTIASYLKEKDPRAGSEMQEIKDILAEIQASYKDSGELNTLDRFYKTMGENVMNHQIHQVALEKLTLLKSSPAIDLLVQLVKKSIQNQARPTEQDFERVDSQIAELIRFLPTQSMKDAILASIKEIKNSSTQETLDQYLQQLDQIIGGQKADIASAMNHQVNDFEDSVDQWSRAIDKIFEDTYSPRKKANKLEIVGENEDDSSSLVSHVKEALQTIEKGIEDLEKIEIKDQEGSNSTIGAIGNYLVSGVATGVGGVLGLTLGGGAGAAGGAAAGGVLADMLSAYIKEGASGLGNAALNAMKEQAREAIPEVLMPKLMRKVDSLYSLLQKEHTWQGLGNGALDATVTYFNQR